MVVNLNFISMYDMIFNSIQFFHKLGRFERSHLEIFDGIEY